MEVNVVRKSKTEGKDRYTRLHFPDAPTKVTWSQLQDKIAKELKISKSRQRVTTTDKQVVLGEDEDKITLADHGLGTSSVEVILKDLGPQMSWRAVYLVEYLGPLLIHPLIYHLSPKHYSEPYHHSLLQKIALGCILFHFVKRELETLFVHRFSRATMPFFNLFKNCGHYWGLSGIALAVPLYGPWHSAEAIGRTDIQNNTLYLGACLAVFFFAEFANLATHLYLSSLRSNGSKKRQLPNGFGFKTCTSANYSFEVLAWVAFSALTLEWAALGFTIVGFLQIALWAKKKHLSYVKEFGKDKVKGRNILIPYLF